MPLTVRVILLAVLLLVSSTAIRTQTGNAPAPESSPEITKEDDHLPFMRQERSAESDSEPGSGMLLVRSFGALLLIVGLIFFGAWGARKLGFVTDKPAGADAIDLSVVSTVNLGNGRSICAVNFDGRTLLVGSTANAITLIAESGNAAAAKAPRSVAEMLEDESADFAREFEIASARTGEEL